jgi:hypothetical protein
VEEEVQWDGADEEFDEDLRGRVTGNDIKHVGRLMFCIVGMKKVTCNEKSAELICEERDGDFGPRRGSLYMSVELGLGDCIAACHR